jgi:hypothetical protein
MTAIRLTLLPFRPRPSLWHGPALYLIPEHLAATLLSQPRFIDRATKHPGRDLASYLLRGNRDRIPVLRAGYRSPGQLKRGVDAFLQRVPKRGLRTVVVP